MKEFFEELKQSLEDAIMYEKNLADFRKKQYETRELNYLMQELINAAAADDDKIQAEGKVRVSTHSRTKKNQEEIYELSVGGEVIATGTDLEGINNLYDLIVEDLGTNEDMYNIPSVSLKKIKLL